MARIKITLPNKDAVKSPRYTLLNRASGVADGCKCNICHKRFKNLLDARNHFQKKHAEQEKVCCHYCSKEFTRKHSLKRHIKEKHLQTNAYECQNCHKKFSRKTNLERHSKKQHC